MTNFWMVDAKEEIEFRRSWIPLRQPVEAKEDVLPCD
jgi:hypothetical protein